MAHGKQLKEHIDPLIKCFLNSLQRFVNHVQSTSQIKKNKTFRPNLKDFAIKLMDYFE